MKSRLERLFSRTAGHRKGVFGVLIAGVILVPLVVAGLFAGALGSVDKRVDTIPAVVVNNDTMVTTTAADGKKQPVLAGRQLVTQLTGTSQANFRWSISNSADAKKALDDGSAYAVLTIPKDFSTSVVSISGKNPKRAQLSIHTDDAHSYLAGSVAQSVGTAMTAALGRQITAQYLAGLYAGLSGIGGSLSSAAGGAASLSSGSASLASGLDALSSGATSAASGASSLGSGVDTYTSGVDTLASGATSLASQTASLGELGSGIVSYANGTAQLSSALTTANEKLQSADPVVAAEGKAQVASLSAQLAQATSGASALVSGASGLGGVHDGISRLASGASQLSSGSPSLREGAAQLATGVGGLSRGASESASGAHQLSGGAAQLASGLKSGAQQAPGATSANAQKTAKIVADPVGFTVSRSNPIDSVGSVIGMIFVPIGLWLGAMAIFFLLKPLSAVSLASTASTARLLVHGLGRAAGLALAQAAALTALVHLALGVSWSMLPATLSFSVLLALAFVAMHYLLTVAFGRVGFVISLLLLVAQLTTVTGLVPLQVVSVPFQALSPLLPLSYAISGMQGIVSGAGGAAVAGPAVVLALIALASIGISYVVVARRRGARSFGYGLARGSA